MKGVCWERGQRPAALIPNDPNGDASRLLESFRGVPALPIAMRLRITPGSSERSRVCEYVVIDACSAVQLRMGAHGWSLGWSKIGSCIAVGVNQVREGV